MIKEFFSIKILSFSKSVNEWAKIFPVSNISASSLKIGMKTLVEKTKSRDLVLPNLAAWYIVHQKTLQTTLNDVLR